MKNILVHNRQILSLFFIIVTKLKSKIQIIHKQRTVQ
jgi:hypothetical protein